MDPLVRSSVETPPSLNLSTAAIASSLSSKLILLLIKPDSVPIGHRYLMVVSTNLIYIG